MRTYCEFVAASSNTDATGISLGLANYYANMSSHLGTDTNSIGYYSTGAVKQNNTTAGSGSTWGLSDIIGMIFDDIAGTLEFLKNNTSSVTYTGVPAGTWYPSAVLSQGDTVTGRFSEAEWTYTPTSAYGWSSFYYDSTPPFDPTISWDENNTLGTVAVTDNTVATVTGTVGAIAGTYARDTGKYFFNITQQTFPTLDSRFGIMFGETLSLTPGDDSDAVVLRHNGSNGEVWTNGNIDAYLSYSNGDPFDVYVDLDAGTAIFYHFSGTSWTHNFTSGTPVKPIFAGVEFDACTLICDPVVLDGNQLDATKTDYLPWFDGL